MAHPDVTMVETAIHNPSEPRHFMRLKPVARRVRVLRGSLVLAETTTGALRLLVVGKDLYDPVFYLPPEAIRVGLRRNPDAATRCPLKGEAAYFDLVDGDGAVVEPKLAWTYPEPFDFATDLAGRIAFHADKVTVEEAPL